MSTHTHEYLANTNKRSLDDEKCNRASKRKQKLSGFDLFGIGSCAVTTK